MNTTNFGNEELISFDNKNIKNFQKSIDSLNNGLLKNVKIPHNIKNIDYQKSLFTNSSEISIKGLIEDSNLSDVFFSNNNINAIQKTIRFNIYNKTNKIISNQSTSALLIIMRSIFLNFSDTSGDFLEQIQILNKKVIDFSISQIETQLKQYDGYLDKLQSLPIPIDRPQQVERNNFTYNIDNLMD